MRLTDSCYVAKSVPGAIPGSTTWNYYSGPCCHFCNVSRAKSSYRRGG